MPEQDWVGHISDSYCGASHHRKVAGGAEKMTARECTLASVHDGAEYVFVSEGKIYRIENQDLPLLHENAGHTVTLTGVLTGDSIRVVNVLANMTPGTLIKVFGIFYDKDQAKRSVERLTETEFPADAVSTLAPQVLGSKDLAHDRDARAGNSTAVVVSSVALGGTAGLVAGIGALAIPGVGALAAVPMLGALAGMGAGGLVGGAIDAIDAAGPPDLEAKRYEGHVEEGGILVTVYCGSPEKVIRAKELLAQTGAQAISSSDETIEEYRAKVEPMPRQ